MSSFKLLCVANDPKTVKGQTHGYLTGVLYLAPASLSGRNVCPHSTAACRESCLNTAGRGRFGKIQQSRIQKTKWLNEQPTSFVTQLWADIQALVRKATRESLIPVVRLNGTSDLPWENIGINGTTTMQVFAGIQFYDYTKVPLRMQKFLDRKMPQNYHLTFSRSGNNDHRLESIVKQAGNVSVVFKGPIPPQWNGTKVVNGDASDLRFLDPNGVIVGLRAKGPAMKHQSSFVINTQS